MSWALLTSTRFMQENEFVCGFPPFARGNSRGRGSKVPHTQRVEVPVDKVVERVVTVPQMSQIQVPVEKIYERVVANKSQTQGACL